MPHSSIWKKLLLKLKHIEVNLIDAESVLLSKAVHAPQKNRQLIRQAIMSGHFPNLVDRIISNGGKLEHFLESDHEYDSFNHRNQQTGSTG